MNIFTHPIPTRNYKLLLLSSFTDQHDKKAVLRTFEDFERGMDRWSYPIRLYVRMNTDRINQGDILSYNGVSFNVERIKNHVGRLVSTYHVCLDNKHINEVYPPTTELEFGVINSTFKLEELN